jgi:TM2 domain-containing membrane protein YozV
MASDGKWYPPESSSALASNLPPPPAPPAPQTGMPAQQYSAPGSQHVPVPYYTVAPQPGAPVTYYAAPAPVVLVEPPKSKSTAALLCFFLGGLGIHRFYTGQTGLGLALLLQCLILVPLTLGLWALVIIVWVVVDFILILAGSVKDRYGRPLL